MSTEMQTAFERDDSIAETDGKQLLFGTPDAIESANPAPEYLTETATPLEEAQAASAGVKKVNLNEV